ncbi:hypothetical protein AAP_04640 [Ascosphaera apis ARSEF 7405]|uniref:Uncharacterized protein n=1 Tax=Ascosphaera apis ARSEF 7405 TaxID=392613 RepID=A0A167WHD7_9EURO|nr:hypothetical protein AAP_04640 [Ascosphaera apis ARSEF 7405]
MSPEHSTYNTDPAVYYALGDILERVCAIHAKLYDIEQTQKNLDRRMAVICAEMGIADSERFTLPPVYASSPPRPYQFSRPTPAVLRPLSASPSLSPLPTCPSSDLPSTVPETEGSGFEDVTDPWQEEETGQRHEQGENDENREDDEDGQTA